MSALLFTFGYRDRAMGSFAEHPLAAGRITRRDLYELDDIVLEGVSALLFSMHADQRFLAARAARIASFIDAGGTVVANGHIAYPFLPDVGSYMPAPGQGLKDLAIHRVAAHPIWEGVSERDLTFRRGVAGFYGRGGHQPPARATIIHTVGQHAQPLDFIYPVGAGRVLLHGGNDLWQYGGGDSTARIAPQLIAWLFGEAP
ncbi:hypothetical protein MXD81_35070 [Microbacteriaceae bacterium K1510]|nr:hypothetical protein [Microbacteriaceae bacterium K1510]